MDCSKARNGGKSFCGFHGNNPRVSEKIVSHFMANINLIEFPPSRGGFSAVCVSKIAESET